MSAEVNAPEASTGGTEPQADPAASGPHRVAPRWDRWDLLVGGVFLVLVTVLYLPYALDSGWFYDDWSFFANFDNAGSSLTARYDACAVESRALACYYHATAYSAFEGHHTAYHLWSMAGLLLIAVLGYRVLLWCRLPRVWAAIPSALLITFPASDATRLWPVASIAQWVIALQLAALLVALGALGRGPGWRRIVLHVLAAAMSLLAMATYEIAVPLVAFNGVVYLAAYRNRSVLWRGVVDLGLALAFLVHRAVIAPPPDGSGFVVERDAGAYLDRAEALLRGAWNSWSFSFARSATIAIVATLALLVLALLAAARDAALPRRLLPWLAIVGASFVLACGGVLVYLTANDLYIPDVTSTFNRLNAPSALAYCVLFVGLLGILYETLRSLAPARLHRVAVPAVVGLIAIGVAWHQAGVLRNHQTGWEQAWDLQDEALDGYRAALRNVPEDASIVGFDTPAWKPGYIPVFAASWDLRGAIDYTTHVNPPMAIPVATGVTCGPTGVLLGEQLMAEYRSQFPLYFVSPARVKAVQIRSQAACQARIDAWGVPPVIG